MFTPSKPDASNYYHNKGGARAQYIDPAERPFIAWDGEGQNLDGPDRPQSYVLFGCSTGDRIKSIGRNLHTIEVCRFVLEVAKRNPTAIHVGFAFGYDSNMIVQSLSRKKLLELHVLGFVYVNDVQQDRRFCIRWTKGKWLSISEHYPKWDRRHNDRASRTVKIYDIFSFFACSFVKAVREMLGSTPELLKVEEGKKHRGGSGNCDECGRDNVCLFDSPEYVESYWETEIGLLRDVATELRTRFVSVGYRITQWYGPGALASFVLKREGIKTHMDESTPAVLPAQYAYAGGRFEHFRLGRVLGPIYSYDINSAYPYALTKLPSLRGGKWTHHRGSCDIAEFGVYRVRLNMGGMFEAKPGPFFYRDKSGNISYPWRVEGWYWSPEIRAAMNRGLPVEILEGWEFTPVNPEPFGFINDMYGQRAKWKAEGNPNQIALKLAMNSMYGKLAQRVGWTEENNQIPPFHQLEWAGWITSYTRAALWWEMSKCKPEQLIAVETDGFYTTASPEQLGITGSKELGGWEIKVLDEIIYLQSGLAWARTGDQWTAKRRGLDPETFSLEACVSYTQSLGAIVDRESRWEPFRGTQTRFIGLAAAIALSGGITKKSDEHPYGELRGDPKEHHCKWNTSGKSIKVGSQGKRMHIPPLCPACRAGKDAYSEAHQLFISTDVSDMPRSRAHYIPWRAADSGATEPEWLARQRFEKDMHTHG